MNAFTLSLRGKPDLKIPTLPTGASIEQIRAFADIAALLDEADRMYARIQHNPGPSEEYNALLECLYRLGEYYLRGEYGEEG